MAGVICHRNVLVVFAKGRDAFVLEGQVEALGAVEAHFGVALIAGDVVNRAVDAGWLDWAVKLVYCAVCCGKRNAIAVLKDRVRAANLAPGGILALLAKN